MKISGIDIKVCGLTRTEDVLAAVELGATAVGFILTPGTREVKPEFVAGFVNRLPSSIRRVGVTIEPSLSEAAALCELAKLTDLQLHGRETTGFLSELKRLKPKLRIIKALTVDENLSAELIQSYVATADLILFDAPKQPPRERLNSMLLKAVVGRVGQEFRFWIAGGLNAQNVAEFVTRLNPSGLDVASGVESSPGVKSRAAIDQFVKAVRGAST